MHIDKWKQTTGSERNYLILTIIYVQTMRGSPLQQMVLGSLYNSPAEEWNENFISNHIQKHSSLVDTEI